MRKAIIGAAIASIALASAAIGHAASAHEATPTTPDTVSVAVRWCEDADASAIGGMSYTACVMFDQTSDAPDAPTAYILYPDGDGPAPAVVLADDAVTVRDTYALVTVSVTR